ncbi:hypothetical protein CLOSTASPAR_05635 [[Clostridium] asparagiforme DSM 15981]|uniref:Uncharacterized protein n=1 Tax=[Clostridium] asparagiforme DSM 15981 TaxID=518636 RepID=C0D8N5_9FIRM|nr:hypothetical protein CLOSTASPAR_05635 [[Clostridium] asparagiforme DSM 15981]
MHIQSALSCAPNLRRSNGFIPPRAAVSAAGQAISAMPTASHPA